MLLAEIGGQRLESRTTAMGISSVCLLTFATVVGGRHQLELQGGDGNTNLHTVARRNMLVNFAILSVHF